MAHSPLEHSKDSAVWTFFDNSLTGKVEIHLPAIVRFRFGKSRSRSPNSW
jgi:hypothetical protein